MAGFVPGRDRYTLDAMDPQDAERNNAGQTAERRAILNKDELAELERSQTGGEPAPRRKRTLLDRLLRRP